MDKFGGISFSVSNTRFDFIVEINQSKMLALYSTYPLWADELYNYCTDFCINLSNLLGIDYITFGSLFFGFFMNGVIILLVILNIVISMKKGQRADKH